MKQPSTRKFETWKFKFGILLFCQFAALYLLRGIKKHLKYISSSYLHGLFLAVDKQRRAFIAKRFSRFVFRWLFVTLVRLSKCLRKWNRTGRHILLSNHPLGIRWCNHAMYHLNHGMSTQRDITVICLSRSVCVTDITFQPLSGPDASMTATETAITIISGLCKHDKPQHLLCVNVV